MLAAILYAIGGAIELLVGFRFLFRLLGANPNNAIVEWVYDWSGPFVAPFAGIFGQDATSVTTQGTATTSVFDSTALIALLIYGVVFALLTRVFTTLGGPR
ncbi:MAG TPA: hypothetical protein VGE30_04085 [Candidatus Saccharimonadales bacterium]